MVIEGSGVSVYFMEFKGQLKVRALQNEESQAFIGLVRNCFTSNDEDVFDCVRRLAKEDGLTVRVG